MDIATVLAFVNMILGIILAVSQFRVLKYLHGACFRWIKIVSGLCGIYWAVIYFVVIISNPIGFPINPVLFGQIFVRPALTVTLAVMSAGAILRSKCG